MYYSLISLRKIMYNLFKKDEIGNPPWNYYFLQNLPESEYPKYLAKLFYLNTGERLPLRHGVIDKRRCKSFNQKIQWLKLYGVTSLMRDCTDKVKVRDYVKEKIGEEYLKPVLQIIPNESKETMRCHCKQVNDNSGLAWQSRDRCNHILDCRGTEKAVVPCNDRALVFKDNDSENNDVSTYFDQIDFDKLPDSFVIKTNHGCKWQYIIKDKEQFLNIPQLFKTVKKNITGWLEQDYSFWGGFEMNYRNIEPKILIEPLMRDDINLNSQEIEVYCFNSTPKLILKLWNNQQNNISLFDEKLTYIDEIFSGNDSKICENANELIKQSFDLSKKLSENFLFVRVDWMIYKNKIWFEELTFTPYSGLRKTLNKKFNKKFGKMINLERI